ncbi:GerAB/ArcD/ProY family transporter [Cohnella luojiensis]|uniref:Uncharacterized protein n=1 Tax=Cohnella luojiensis TaxID=652876 RepID=A0A4Y8M1P2_9BACL|nr:endospore germination permease [Cohnella luojiensis]TFE28595.1 hypothetical protein E2980_07130 [Cohnella luojiensis]
MTSQEKISNKQFGSLVFSFLSGFSTLFLIEAKLIKQDVWMSYLLGITVSIGMLWLFVYAQKQYPHLSMAEIFDELLGKWFAKLALCLYLVYMLETGGAAYRALSFFYTTAILPNTPNIVLMFLIFLCTAYAVYLGLGTLARSIQVILPFFIVAIVIVSFFIVREIDTNPFLPQFQSRASEIVFGGMVTLAFPFGKAIIFGFILSRVKNVKKIFSSTAIPMALSGLYLLAVTYMVFGSLGFNLSHAATFPYFSAAQLVRFGEYMERIEIFVISIWTVFTLFEIIVIQYIFMLVAGHVFRIKETRFFVFPICLLFFAIAHKSFIRMMDLSLYILGIYPISSLLPIVIIPVLIAFLTLVKKPRGAKKSVKINPVG